MSTKTTIRTFVHAGAFALAALAVPTSAHAQSTIRDPNPPRYPVEIEPKLNFNPSGIYYYYGTGFGPGVRFSIPLMSPGFVKTINDSVAISFGLDFMHYDTYTYYYGCGRAGLCAYGSNGFWSFDFPVVMQWNFWLTDKWSVFGEPGFEFRHASVDCAPGVGCGNLDTAYFAFFAGGRYAVSDKLALTMRLGHPIFFSFGLSIFP